MGYHFVAGRHSYKHQRGDKRSAEFRRLQEIEHFSTPTLSTPQVALTKGERKAIKVAMRQNKLDKAGFNVGSPFKGEVMYHNHLS